MDCDCEGRTYEAARALHVVESFCIHLEERERGSKIIHCIKIMHYGYMGRLLKGTYASICSEVSVWK